MSGHSKWSQIKHKKAITDSKKSKIFSRLGREIAIVVREGGPDSATNFKLKAVIDKAKQYNLPQANIDRIISKSAGQDDGQKLENLLIEAYGPDGSAFLITSITDNRNRTISEVRNIITKNGGKPAAEGSVAWLFRHYGKISIPIKEKNKEEAELIAIEQNAEEIDSNEDYVTILTKPELLYITKDAFTSSGFDVEECLLVYVPVNPIVPENPETKKRIANLLNALDDHDDVQEVVTNTETDETD
jgi:YebC/PmpR family DNA-binding regulatory protein